VTGGGVHGEGKGEGKGEEEDESKHEGGSCEEGVYRPHSCKIKDMKDEPSTEEGGTMNVKLDKELSYP
jgi:hypothetical protein